MNVLAVDPGAISGAYAFCNDAGVWFVDDMPVIDKQIDAHQFAAIVNGVKPTVAVIESVHAMPKQGVVSTFKFGVSVGIIRGVLASYAVPMHLVAPSVWKRHFKLTGTDKDAARALAVRLYPSVKGLHLKKHHGRADALLMGRWFFETREPKP